MIGYSNKLASAIYPLCIKKKTPSLSFKLELPINGLQDTYFFISSYEKSIAKASDFPKYFPTGIYLLKVNNRNTSTRCEIFSKLTIKTPKRRHWRRFGVFFVNFEQSSHFVIVLLLITLNM